MRAPQQYIVHRYETQPQLAALNLNPAAHAATVARLQSNPDALRAYLAALGIEGEARERVIRIVAGAATADSAFGGSSFAGPASNGGKVELAEAIKSAMARDPVDPKIHVTESSQRMSGGRNFWVRGPFSALASALSPNSSAAGAGSSASQASYAPPPSSSGSSGASGEPLQIQISESWTWAGMVRRMMVAGVGFLALMTGLSVIFENQPGRGPGGEFVGIHEHRFVCLADNSHHFLAMQSHEVEPYNQPPIRFGDVQGVDEAKEELQEIVEFLKEPKRFMEVGGKLPKGGLLGVQGWPNVRLVWFG